MGIDIQEAVPQPKKLTAKHVIIKSSSGEKILEGDVTPHCYEESVQWHAVLHPKGKGFLCWLIQGHGSSVRTAIASALYTQRLELRAKRDLFQKIEQACETHDLSDVQLRKVSLGTHPNANLNDPAEAGDE